MKLGASASVGRLPRLLGGSCWVVPVDQQVFDGPLLLLKTEFSTLVLVASAIRKPIGLTRYMKPFDRPGGAKEGDFDTGCDGGFPSRTPCDYRVQLLLRKTASIERIPWSTSLLRAKRVFPRSDFLVQLSSAS